MSFNDHFSGHADLYASSRPDYPVELFEYVAGLCSDNQLAWDCAAGNGQAARGLLPYFDRVVLTDASAQQISQASAPEGKEEDFLRAVMLAESIALGDNLVDLVVVAQALHWFDLQKFSRELDRILRPGGILAAWSYGVHHLDEQCDEIVRHLYEDITGPYWPPERRIVENHYVDIEMPYNTIPAPAFKLQKFWSIEQVLGYLRSWSGVQRYQNDLGSDPVLLVEEQLRQAFGDEAKRLVEWPLTLLISRKLA